ncbi:MULTISPECIES: hypothetical protein [unclassified Spirulina]|uniref:hypothetical protein n=1 Tax=unclassified Spirulina TaxID=2684457 RepID=UPI0019500E4C|nr:MULTISPECIES: hypothetical protein [Spirulina]MEA5470368.1 hypothetical protein [Spirulina sp. 06S082]
MGVIYIGDRETGKTSLAMELANPNSHYVKVTHPDYENLKVMLYDDAEGRTKATDASQALYDRALEIQVELPTGKKEILLEWLDTPGEIWRTRWQQADENQPEWQKFLGSIVDSEGILLVVPPYREIISGANREDYITQQQWCNRFERWVKFFRQDCPKVRHLVLCLNKADLFCDVNKEASRLEYSPNRSPMTWQKRNAYVMQRYFRPIQTQIEHLNKNISGLAIRCFITSIHNRKLLELPWIYLGSFLAD